MTDLLPQTTRLRYVTAKKREDIPLYFNALGKRVQIYSINWDGKKWVVWFVPDDRGQDIKSVDLD